MASFEKDHLEYIKGNAVGSDEVNRFLEEKKDALDNLKKQRSTPFNKPSPSLTPNNDITIDRTYRSKGMDVETYNQKFKDINGSYNDKIFQSTKEHFEKNNPPEDMKLLDELGKEDLALLLEKDSDAVIDKHKQQDLEKNEADKQVLDITMNEEKSKNVFGDLEDGQEISSLEEKEITHNKEIEHSIHMDDEKSEKVFGRGSGLDEFKDNSKDITVDRSKAPSPTDDFE